MDSRSDRKETEGFEGVMVPSLAMYPPLPRANDDGPPLTEEILEDGKRCGGDRLLQDNSEDPPLDVN
jgi:hypothetical protein